jgi:hypothetical protein
MIRKYLLMAMAAVCIPAAITTAVSAQLFQSPGVIGGSLNSSEEERIFCGVCSILAPHLIPDGLRADYVSVHPRCGTLPILEALQNFDRFGIDKRAKLATFFQRPSSQRSFASAGGHFLIHYDTSGFHAVDKTDSDSNGIPDYVDFVAATFEDVWTKEIDELGYITPPDDGDGVYDVHIQQLGLQGVYGFAFPAGGLTSSSYIQIDNNFTDNVYQTRGGAGVQVTAAHEFFHAIQFAYYASFDAAWWQELTATWMEDVVYDDVNDYLQYQPFFFQSPEVSLDQFRPGDLQPFAASVFGHFIWKMFGVDSVKDTWQSLASRTPLSYDISDIDVALPGGFTSIMPRFTVWNYLTGSRHISGYYEEGSAYAEVNSRVITAVSGLSVSGSDRIDHLSSTYISIDTRNLSGGLSVVFSLESGSTYEVVMLLMRDGTPEVVSLSGDGVSLANVSSYDEVVLIPVSTSTSGSGFDIGYTVLNSSSITTTSDLVGDFDSDGSVAFADFLAFAVSFGKGPGDSAHVRKHDMNADGDIGFGDFLIFASHFGESR